MNKNLLTTLININIVKPGTEIAMLRIGNSMVGSGATSLKMRVFSTEDKDGNQQQIEVNANHLVEIYKCEIIDEEISIYAHSVVDGEKFILNDEDIVLIDSMLPEKLAAVYGYTPDGIKKIQGKKRGRKPKIRE